jgi:hypothetical protein
VHTIYFRYFTPELFSMQASQYFSYFYQSI